MADDAENAAPVNQKRSFTREFKLNAVGHYYHGKNIQNTAQHFNVDRKQVQEWLKNELKLNKQEKDTRADGRSRVAFHRAMELRKAGKVVKGWWFTKRGKQILDESNPNHNFKFSHQ